MIREDIILHISKKKIALCLIIIASISLLLKLYTIDFSLPPVFGDSVWFVLRGIANSQGNFAESPFKTAGWPLFLSPFFYILNSNNFNDYANLTRAFTLGISTFTIMPMYLLGRKFFNEKYSIIGVILFAFIPDLNFHAGKGVSEPLFILVFIIMFIFILNNKSKYIFLSFLMAGLFWWVRISGILAVISLTIIYFIYHRHSKNLFRNYIICIAIFLIIVSPILVQRYIQYGNPIYVAGFSEDDVAYHIFVPYELKTEEIIMSGIKNTLTVMYKMSLPYLIFLFPVGMFFSFWLTGQNKKNFNINWIFLISIIPIMAIVLTAGPQTRWLFSIYPLLIIFSILGTKAITENRFNPFSYTKKKQNIFLILVVGLVIISSGLFTHGVGKYGIVPYDAIKINERMDYANFLLNIDGKMFWDNTSLSPQFVFITLLERPDVDFKKFRINPEPTYSIDFTEFDSFNPTNFRIIKEQTIERNSLEEIIISGEEKELRYLHIDGVSNLEFLNDIFKNEEKYPYLNKIFDWEEAGFQRYKVKAFEIDYEKFHQMND